MKKFVGFIALFLLVCQNSYAIRIYQIPKHVEEKAVALTPLLSKENMEILTKFRKAFPEDKMPPEIFADLMDKSIGFRGGKYRTLTDQEREYLKRNLARLHELTFVENLNLTYMGFEDLPDTIANFPHLKLLDLRFNYLKSVPQAIHILLDRGQRVEFDLDRNLNIPSDDNVAIRRKEMELILAKNVESQISGDKLKWSSKILNSLPKDILDKTDDTEVTPKHLFSVAFEFAGLHLLRKGDDYVKPWFKEDFNCSRLRHFFSTYTPAEAFAYAAAHPDDFISLNMRPLSMEEIRAFFVNNVITYLCHSQKLSIVVHTIHEKKIREVKETVGWRNYFTAEPKLDNQDIWLTPNGIRAFFESVGFIADPNDDKLTADEMAKVNAFEAKTGKVPQLILEDIKVHKSIGVRDGNVRPMSGVEREWVKEHLEHVPLLSFLTHLNLTSLAISYMPSGLKALTALKEIHLDNNEFRKLPDVFADFYARYQNLHLYISGNKLKEGENARFNTVCAEKQKVAEEAQIVDSTLDISKLRWHPELLAKVGEAYPLKKKSDFHPLYLVFFIRYLECLSREKTVKEPIISKELIDTMRPELYGLLTSKTPQELIKLVANRDEFFSEIIEYYLKIEDKNFVPLNYLDFEDDPKFDKEMHDKIIAAYPQVFDDLVDAGMMNPVRKPTVLKDLESLPHLPKKTKAVPKKVEKTKAALKKGEKDNNFETSYNAMLQKRQEMFDERFRLYVPAIQAMSTISLPLFQSLTKVLVSASKMRQVIKNGPNAAVALPVLDFFGWEKYMTQKPASLFDGWFTELGLAELLVALDLMVVVN